MNIEFIYPGRLCSCLGNSALNVPSFPDFDIALRTNWLLITRIFGVVVLDMLYTAALL